MTEIRAIVVGDGGVGKSASVIQFVSGHFVDEYDPTIEDSYRKQVVVDGSTRLLDLLDTAGMEEYSAMRDQYLRSAQAAYFVYSITSRRSFDELTRIHEQLVRVRDQGADMVFPIVVCGNKADLDDKREVTADEGAALAKSFGAEFFETSAKTRVNIEEAFFALMRQWAKLNDTADAQGRARRGGGGGRHKAKCSLL